MPFYFEQFPTISYDVKKNNRPVNVQNILLRYKVKEILKKFVKVLL